MKLDADTERFVRTLADLSPNGVALLARFVEVIKDADDVTMAHAERLIERRLPLRVIVEDLERPLPPAS